MEYLGLHLTNHVEDLCAGKYRLPMKEATDRIDGEPQHAHRWRPQHSVAVNAPRIDLQVYAIPIAIPAKIFVDTAKFIFKFIWKGTSHEITKTISKMKTQVRRISLPEVKTYRMAVVIRAVWYWKGGGQRSTDQNRGPKSIPTHVCPTDFWQKC